MILPWPWWIHVIILALAVFAAYELGARNEGKVWRRRTDEHNEMIKKARKHD